MNMATFVNRVTRSLSEGKASYQEAASDLLEAGFIGMYSPPCQVVGAKNEEMVSLIGKDAKKGEVILNVRGIYYKYKLSKDNFKKFDRLWSVYKAHGQALSWIKSVQTGVEKLKPEKVRAAVAKEGALTGLKGKG